MADRPLGAAEKSEEPSGETHFRTFAGTISRGMKVLSSENQLIGQVDRVEGDHIVLVSESEPGTYFVPLSLIDGITKDQVLLAGRGDGTFGLGATP